MSKIEVKLVTTKKQANEAYDLTLEMIQTMGYDFNPMREEFVEKLLENKDRACVFLAKDADIAVGIATLGINFGVYDGGLYGFFVGLYVNPNYRRKGLADMLYQSVIDKAKALKLKSVVWFVHDNNKAALNFFNKQGLEKSAHKLHMFLLNSNNL